MEQLVFAENRVFEIDGHDFLFLVGENAVFELDSETRKLIDDCPRPLAIDQANGTDADLIRVLLDRRIIVPKKRPDAASAHPDFAVPSNALNTLILNVTDDCNLGCTYCYHGLADRAKIESPNGQPAKKMTIETARDAIDFLLTNSGVQKKVVLVFFGGEPFLNFDVIEDAVEYARKEAARAGKEVDFAITTNGTLLIEKVVGFINDNNIGVTISVDGPESTHDRHRRFPDGSPSFEVVERGVRRLLDAENGRPVVARATVARARSGKSLNEDIENLVEAADKLLGMGFSEVGFAPVTTSDCAYQLADGDMDCLLDQFRALSDKFLDVALGGDFFGFSNLIDLLVTLHEGEVKSHPCGAGVGLLAVDTAGGLHLCQRLTGDGPDLGDIGSGPDRIAVAEFLREVEAERDGFCGGCWVRAICAGGCYHEALVRQGGLAKPNAHYCEWIRNWIEIGMGVYGRLALNAPDYLDKLSALRGHAASFNRYT